MISGLRSQPLEFKEDFDNNDNGWVVFNNSRGSAIIDSSSLKIRNKSGNGLLNLISHYIDPYQEFEIVTSFKYLSRKSHFGLVWGASGSSSFFAFQIYPDNSFDVVINREGRFYQMIKREPLPRNRYGIEENMMLLKVKKIGSNLKFEANGHYLGTTEFMMFVGTDMGFSIGDKTSVSIDRLEVYQNTIPINLVTEEVGFEMENLGPDINSEFSENGVVVSPDGTEMFVVRNRHPDNLGQMKKDDIWHSVLDENNNWTPLKNIGYPLNNTGSNFVISVTPGGNGLLVGNLYQQDGSPGGPGLSFSHLTPTGWEVPKPVIINDFRNLDRFVDFSLSPNQQVLVMAIDDGKTEGGLDLFVSFKNGDVWSKPKNMGSMVNSFANDFTPFIAADNETLYFSSFGHPGYGSADIFVTRRLDDTWTSWTEPQNMGKGINSKSWDANLSIPASGQHAYLTSTENSIGDIDIYRMELKEAMKPNPVVSIQGVVMDKSTGEGISANVIYYRLSDNQTLGQLRSEHGGRFSIVLPEGDHYGIRSLKEGYFGIAININTKNLESYQVIEQNLFLSSLQADELITLDNIFFESNKSVLMTQSTFELDRLVTILEKDKTLSAEIYGHTDNVGTQSTNQVLSEERARAVHAYLTQFIVPERLIYVGMGESKPIADNKTEGGRSKNRRVEIKLVSN